MNTVDHATFASTLVPIDQAACAAGLTASVVASESTTFDPAIPRTTMTARPAPTNAAPTSIKVCRRRPRARYTASANIATTSNGSTSARLRSRLTASCIVFSWLDVTILS